MNINRIIETLEWLVTDAKYRFNTGPNPGNYSPELKEAIELLETLKKEYRGSYMATTREQRRWITTASRNRELQQVARRRQNARK